MTGIAAPQSGMPPGLATRLADTLRDLFRREQGIDRMEVAEESDREQIDAHRELNFQAIEGVEKAITCLAAVTPQEAVVQVLLAAGQLNSIDAEPAEGPPDPGRLKAAVQLLSAALPVLAAEVGIDLKDYGAEGYGLMPQQWPFFPTDLQADGHRARPSF